MEILASALPGFRDLRAPLTAGYLWLIFLWIALSPDLDVRPANDIAGAVYDLGSAAGPIWVGIAVGVAAYLIGSISQIMSPALGSLLDTIWRKLYSYFVIGDEKSGGARPRRTRTVPRIFVNYHRDPVDKIYYLAVHRMYEYRYRDQRGDTPNYDELADVHAREARIGLLEEIKLPATLLIGQEPQLFSEADRLKAEGQFRLAIVPPLVAITIFISLSVSPLWFIGFVPILILLWQSQTRSLEYRYLMFGAVERGIIKSESLDNLKLWVETLKPEEGPMLL